MPKIETINPQRTLPFRKRKIESIDTAQLEYTAQTLFTYATIVCFTFGALASIAYMTVQQLKK